MPQVIPYAIGAIASAAGASAVVAGALSLAAALLIGGMQQRQAKKKAGSDYNASQVDRMANVVTSISPRELVLGRVRKGGGVAFRGSAGGVSEKFIVHLTLAAHEIDAVEAVWLNDQRVTVDPSTRAVQEAPYMRTRRLTRGFDDSPIVIPAGLVSVTLPNTPEPGSVRAVMFNPFVGMLDLPHTVVGNTVTLTAPQEYLTEILYQAIERTPTAYIYWDLGAPGSVASPVTKQYFPHLWTDNHRGEGVAKLVAHFEYDDSAFPNGVPAITVLIRGAKVYDPRSGLTAWSENPALLSRHVYQHQHFGKATVSAAEDVRIAAAANACDVSQNYVVDGVTQTSALYRAGLLVPFGTTAASVLDDLCQAMGGMWAFAGGELYLRAGVYTAPVMTFTDSDVVGTQMVGGSEQQESVTISVHRERAEKFNVVNARIWDARQDYKEAPLAPLKGAALIAADGEELSQEVPLPGVPYAPQALHIAGVMMRDARDPLTIQVSLKMRAYPVELFETVAFALSRYGWDSIAKTFVVLSRVWDRQKGLIRLTCKETNAAIFTPDAAFAPGGYGENTALPDPWGIEDPGALSVTSGTDELAVAADGTIVTRVRVTWPTVTDQRIINGGHIEVQWANVEAGQWNSIVIDGSVPEVLIPGLSDGAAILVRARTRTSVASSDWGIQQLHIVVGKSQLPSDVVSFSVDRGGIASWPLVTDADVRAGGGYMIRWQPGTNRSWGDASPLHGGVLTDTPYAIMIRPAGVATFMIKAVDSSGNESQNVAASVINLGDPLVENVLVSTDYKALGFPGAFVNATIVGGDLVADVDAFPIAWDENPETAGWTLDTDPGWTGTTYKPVTYTADPYIVASVDEGAQLTLQHEIVGTAFLILYRRDGDSPGWTSDAEPGWTDDAALAWDEEEFRPWPGTVNARAGRYQFSVTSQSRDVQTVISYLTAQLDVPDLIEQVGQVAIAPGGTVIPITKSFRTVLGIGLTLVGDGGSAETAQVESLTTRTVTTRDASRASVAGTVLATLQGY